LPGTNAPAYNTTVLIPIVNSIIVHALLES